MPQGSVINSMFSGIADQYDLANHVLSFGRDFSWRKKLVNLVQEENPKIIVDLATGSGDVAFALKKQFKNTATIMGLDFCKDMLVKAEKKKRKRSYAKDISFDFGDCMDLPLRDSSVDTITIAFGYRNFEDRQKGLKEIRRVLKPTGTLFILEFSQPSPKFRPFYYFYLKNILPKLAKMTTGKSEAYQYLIGSIESFPTKADVIEEIRIAGFSAIQAFSLSGGAVAIHKAFR